MKNIPIIPILILIVCCSSFDKPKNTVTNKKETVDSTKIDKKELNSPPSSNSNLTSKSVTINVSYAAIECGCPQWFETKNGKGNSTRNIEKFYLEPVDSTLTNANRLWDGEHLPLSLTLVGEFSKEKELPKTYHVKGEPQKARIFWYKTLIINSPNYRK